MLVNIGYGVFSGLLSILVFGGNELSFIMAFIFTFIGCCLIDVIAQRQFDTISKRGENGKDVQGE